MRNEVPVDGSVEGTLFQVEVRPEGIRGARADPEVVDIGPASVTEPDFSVGFLATDHRQIGAPLEALVEFCRSQGQGAELYPFDEVGCRKFQTEGEARLWDIPVREEVVALI